MTVQKITLSVSRDIPFNKLILSQSNVRRIKAGVSIEELAEDIARRTLLQSLTVRPVRDDDGNETGLYEIPAGGRRYRALERLVKQKRLAKTAPIPCVIREGGIAEEDSLAENLQRAPLHPLDQFRAFLTLREKGLTEEEVAARFFVSVAVVKQRLRLASVSPQLLEAYAEDELGLDQLMAFTINGDHARQLQVFERLKTSYDKQPYTIRRMLTEGAVRASDKRTQFIGIDSYVEAGGVILNDLFQGDDGGWLQDVALVDRLVAEKLEREAEAIRAEGWKWLELAPDFAYGHTFGLRQLRGEEVPLTADEQSARDALQAEFDRLEQAYGEADELPEEVDARLAEIETALTGFEDRPVRFDADDIASAGAFVSIDGAGQLRVERGFVRPEDEMPVAAQSDTDGNGAEEFAAGADAGDGDGDADPQASAEPEEDDGIKPLPDRLMTELTAHRTLGLRHQLGERPDIAVFAALHALALNIFYPYGTETCLELDLKSVSFPAQTPGLNDGTAAEAIRLRHEAWAKALPKEPAELWDALADWEEARRAELFAHCVSLSVNAVFEPYHRRPRALAHADRLAQSLDLDMAAEGWAPTVDTYLGRVTKARILEAVQEAKGQPAADRLAHLKKGEMAVQAETLLAGSFWLPEPLRTPGQGVTTAPSDQPSQSGAEAPAGETAEPTAGDDAARADEAGGTPAIAAE